MTLRQIVNNDDDGDENNDDIDDDDALFALESAHTRDQCDVELVICSKEPKWRPQTCCWAVSYLGLHLPLLAVSWELWPGIWRHENLLVCEPEREAYTSLHSTLHQLLTALNLKVCLPQHLPGSSWKQEWLRPNLPSPTTAIRGCSLSAGVWGPAGQEGGHGGPGAGAGEALFPHCLPCSPTLAGCLTILTSLPSLPDCAGPPPGAAAKAH